MGQLSQLGALEFSPGEMHKRPILAIKPGARHAGSIDQCRSVAVAQQVLPETGAPFEGMVHVAENHQICRSIPRHAIQGEGKILITPVNSWRFPIPTTRTGCIRAQPRGTAMGHHDQGLIGGDTCRGLNDPIGGRLKRHRSVNRLHGI